MKISNSHGITFILELAEPPAQLLDDWKKERVAYYQRFEPFGELMNHGIKLPDDTDLSRVLKLTGSASNAFWTALLLEKSVTSIRNIDAKYYKPWLHGDD